MTTLVEKYKDQLIALIRQHVPRGRIYLFGSRATGKAQSGSDIDIALDAGTCIPRDNILALLTALDETIIPVHIDIIDMHMVGNEMKESIVREGILWTD
jgi:predicted nucleotidyltransferase